MPTIDEILAAMPEPAAEGDHEYLVIDPATRSITVPEAEQIFGVTGDEIADRKYFICPRIVGDGLDLASMFIRVNFRNANGEEDGYLVNDVAVSGEYVTFSWQLSAKVAAYKGAVQFGVCADLPNTADRRMPDWNTTMATGDVLEGLDPDDGNVEGATSDVVTQLRAETAAQTGKVQNEGVTQIQAVQAAAAAATADAQAQIEAKGTATLSTIPEDYSAMGAKVNEFANAIKGSLSGAVIRADDVSPVEHYPAVWVHGKNLCSWELQAGHYVETSLGLTNTNSTVYRSFQVYLKKGVYTLSVSTRVMLLRRWLDGVMSLPSQYGTSFTFEVKTDGVAAFSLRPDPSADWDDAITLQLERGDTATDYTPYIDPTTVTLTRCGKNLLKNKAVTQATDGITFDVKEDGSVVCNGTATQFVFLTVPVYLQPGSYTLSGCPAGGAEDTYSNIFNAGSERYYYDTGNGVTFDVQQPGEYDVYLCRFCPGTTISATFRPMLRLASVADASFEPYNGTNYTPAADGTVGGLTSLAPTMTLLANTPDVVIDCTYNRDTNAVLAEILERLTALGS